MKVAFVLIALTLLAGCPSAEFLEQTVGVEKGENALMCAHVDVDRPLTESRASYRRAEIPEGVDLTKLTPEQIRALYDC